MAKALYLLTDLSPMNLSIDLYNRDKHNDNDKATQKHIKINSPKRSLRKDYKKYYANNTKNRKNHSNQTKKT